MDPRAALRPLGTVLRRARREWAAIIRRPDPEPLELRHIKELLRLLSRIHAFLRPPTYLEIGVAEGNSLAQALPSTLALGIDPALEIQVPLRGRTKLFRLSSDEFFRERDVWEELEGEPVALAFIDGLHLFEQALRDFMNIERYCAAGSVILMHDCMPRDSETCTREQRTEFWTGDTWKVIPCLSRYRPDLLIRSLDVPPSGLAVIRRLDPSSRVLEEDYERACEEFIPLGYEDLVADGEDATLKRTGHDWETVLQVLGATETSGRG